MRLALFSIILGIFSSSVANDTPPNFQTDQLVAWCIVPFDANKRGPKDRAEMLSKLGIKRSAYDWRKEHVTEFEEEILQYQKHGIEFFAFWSGHDEAFPLFAKYKIHPQIWKTAPSPAKETQQEKVEAAALAFEALAKRTAALQCPLGLYNHGGWGGEPENLVAVTKRLHEMGYPHVGIVYNWHHAHEQIADWPNALALMKPYLLCLNLNGMNPGAEPKILELGKGAQEEQMLRTVFESGYEGPIGVIDHQNELDTEIALRANIEGLKKLVKSISK